ncbi:MAG: hypothetical protein VX278_22915 [Myxococcota bacterium]|nr:hypothetical protein [Myxococcota bacterium]
MGVRTRIKSMIKKLILRQKESTENEKYTPPPSTSEQSKTSFEPVQAPSQPEEVAPVSTAPVAESIETQPPPKEEVAEGRSVPEPDAETSAAETKVEEDTIEAASETEAEVEVETEKAAPAETESAAPEVEEASETEAEEAIAQAEGTDEKSNGNGIDTTGAFAVYSISNIFPDTCPNCGASTYGNWEYTDKTFVCSSCDTPF